MQYNEIDHGFNDDFDDDSADDCDDDCYGDFHCGYAGRHLCWNVHCVWVAMCVAEFDVRAADSDESDMRAPDYGEDFDMRAVGHDEDFDIRAANFGENFGFDDDDEPGRAV